MNSLFTINPYWTGSTWAFDAPSVDLEAEPFIAGADTILTNIIKEHLGIIPSLGIQFSLIFSATGFPGYHARLIRKEEEFGGYWYVTDQGERGWLCPATLKFFPNGHPEHLYILVKHYN